MKNKKFQGLKRLKTLLRITAKRTLNNLGFYNCFSSLLIIMMKRKLGFDNPIHRIYNNIFFSYSTSLLVTQSTNMKTSPTFTQKNQSSSEVSIEE